MSYLIRGAVLAAALYLGLLGVLLALMYQPPETFARAMAHVPTTVAFGAVPFPRLWNMARGGSLKAGDPAPDFDLATPDGSGRVRLSSFRGQRPVALVFGSYT